MENNNDFVKDWLEGKITSEQLETRKKDGDPTVRQYEEIINRTSGMRLPEFTSKEDAWKKFSDRVTQAPETKTKVIAFNPWATVGIAASVTLLTVAFFLLRTVEVSTKMAETKVHQLPDGSTVTLNADSHISFSRFTWSANREVVLEGEAFFEVTKGSTFSVESSSGTVTVLGTSFNVKARESSFQVSCFTGKVKVESGEKVVMLTRGLTTDLQERGLTEAKPFDVGKTAWREGNFYFDATPLAQVIDELERQFDVQIVFSGDGSRKYTGYFSNRDINGALMMVFKPMSLNYRLQDEKTIIVD